MKFIRFEKRDGRVEFINTNEIRSIRSHDKQCEVLFTTFSIHVNCTADEFIKMVGGSVVDCGNQYGKHDYAELEVKQIMSAWGNWDEAQRFSCADDLHKLFYMLDQKKISEEMNDFFHKVMPSVNVYRPRIGAR